MTYYKRNDTRNDYIRRAAAPRVLTVTPVIALSKRTNYSYLLLSYKNGYRARLRLRCDATCLHLRVVNARRRILPAIMDSRGNAWIIWLLSSLPGNSRFRVRRALPYAENWTRGKLLIRRSLLAAVQLRVRNSRSSRRRTLAASSEETFKNDKNQHFLLNP